MIDTNSSKTASVVAFGIQPPKTDPLLSKRQMNIMDDDGATAESQRTMVADTDGDEQDSESYQAYPRSTNAAF